MPSTTDFRASPTSSSSSSPSSSNPGLPESRATTPSSEIISSCDYKCIVPNASCDALSLAAAFEKHAEGGLLRVVFANDSQYDFQAAHGTEQLTSCGECFSTKFPSDAYAPDIIQLSTDPIQARHLLLISQASLRSIYSAALDSGKCALHILEKPRFAFLPLSSTPSFKSTEPYATLESGNIPTPEEWHTLWSSWDLITIGMIPQEMLHQKPIDLRHKCLFYIGHIPTFLDMLLSKAIGGSPTEPSYFWNIFERGIDPHVDDPDHCHSHSEVPEKDEDWPTIDTIIKFRNGVRQRLMKLYEDLQSGKRTLTRNIARTLVMTIEHEGWHIETLLYMLIQRAGTGTLPPPGFAVPRWDALIEQWNATPSPPTSSVVVGPDTVTLGHDDCEGEDHLPKNANDVDGRILGWDNESPARNVKVKAFRAEWRPVTNGEFLTFLRGTGKGLVDLPKSWVEEDGNVEVRTMYGLIPMNIAQHWPVLTSYDDISVYAKFKGGRLPTEPELRLFLNTYDVGHEGGANIGFRNWHPVPATTGLEEYEGRGSNGGVWEWTSTLFDGHDGLSPTKLFTGYSTDFFDTKHRVVLGASYATIPRLAGRRTVRNFYQHNYPYPWAGARIVYDL